MTAPASPSQYKTPKLKLQRLLTRGGAGAMPEVCVIDVGAIGRWAYETQGQGSPVNVWADLHQATVRSSRRYIWIAAMPGGVASTFTSTELADVVRELRALGIACINSAEAVTSLFASGSSVPLPEWIAIVSAEIHEYPEHLSVLERNVHSVLDVVDGALHTYWTQYRDRRGEPLFLPERQAAVRSDPALKGRPPGGMAAPRYVRQIDAHLQGNADPDAGANAPVLPPPQYTLDSMAKNKPRILARADELIGRDKIDASARVAVERNLPNRVVFSSNTTPPIVVVAFDNANNGVVRLSKLPAYACQASTTLQVSPGDLAVQSMLRQVVCACPDLWVAPRALDLLAYMAEHEIPLPERVVDPAHCAFALCPDQLMLAVAACPSAASLSPDVARWLWDVKRKEPAPADLDALATQLPNIMRELRARTKRRGLDPLIDDDLAPTLPVLACMERKGASIGGNVGAVNQQLDVELGRLEAAFRPVLGDIDPYRALPDTLVDKLAAHGITLPTAYSITNDEPANTLQRLAQHDPAAAALVEARSISVVQKWVRIVEDSGDRLRGRYFPEVAGRFGMNAHGLQAMPKRQPAAKALRSLLVAPPGKFVVAADFSSFELRLAAGLSKDPLLLNAAVQQDAFAHLADQYFAHTDPDRRAKMKAYWHPIGYGMRQRGFAQEQANLATAEAAAAYDTLRHDFASFFGWRRGLSAAAGARGLIRTRGGWQRAPQASVAPGSARAYARWKDNAIVSTAVQGLAADIQRWCLRELHRTLPDLGAELIFRKSR